LEGGGRDHFKAVYRHLSRETEEYDEDRAGNLAEGRIGHFPNTILQNLTKLSYPVAFSYFKTV
jgi:hypothetical protein